MTRLHIRFSLIILIALLSGAIGTLHAQDVNWYNGRYAFLVENETGQPEFLLVDPRYPSATPSDGMEDNFFPFGARIKPIPSPEFEVRPEFLSPDGSTMLRSFVDEATQDILFGLWYVNDPEDQPLYGDVYNNGPDQTEIEEVAWSPNSEYVAYTFFWPSRVTGHLRLYLHSKSTQETTILYEDETWTEPHNLVWSPDSQYLALTPQHCTSLSCYPNARLAIYSLADQTVILSDQMDASIPKPTCGYQWSPDNRYLVFKGGCDAYPRYFEDVYVWDREQNEIQEVTNLTNEYPYADDTRAEDLEPYINSYSYLWVDSDTLMISYRQLAGGTHFQINHFATQVILYHVSDRTTTVLADDWYMLGLQQSPAGNLFAFLKGTSTLTPLLDDRFFGELTETAETLHIGSIQDGKLIELYTGIPDCNLQWSPDGRFLAYAIFEEETQECTSYIFFDTQTNTTTQFSFPPDQPFQRFGWMEGPGLG